MDYFDESGFRERLDAALGHIRRVLDTSRHPQYAADVPHRYDDKYLLVESLIRVGTASVLQSLEAIGASAAQLATMREWARQRAVTLRLVVHEECTYLREVQRKIESPEIITETKGFLGKSSRSEKIVTTITEHLWRFGVDYELVAFAGTDTDKPITLHARAASVEIRTAKKEVPPRPKAVSQPDLDVDVTWLFAHLDGEGRAAFAIDRTSPECHTPRRNDDVDGALAAFEELATWVEEVVTYFIDELFPAQQDHGLDLSAIDPTPVLVPVLPLFEEASGDASVLPASLAIAFLAEEQRSLAETCRGLGAVFPRDGSIITAVEAALLVTLQHVGLVCTQLDESVAYVEHMLHMQLVAAIGKEVTAADFTAYMEFHQRKLFAPPYRPQPFSYAVRRPGHDPEGVVAIERGAGDAAITTTVRRTEAARPMYIPLDASTRIAFGGERYLHAWIGHQFSGEDGPAPQLVARARQFSSFLVLVGRIVSADTFEPRAGIIVQNKDLLKLPLALEQLPTPKEFRDAIASLSPEQQRFARAVRGMQLESTLFAVCIIQIKPQLEKLLRLPPDSLTKEIRTTQDLSSLLIEYQIPSDLLSYDGPDDASTESKLQRVQQYVARMHEMIALSKERELAEEREREAMRVAEQNRTYAMPTAPSAVAFAPPPAPGGMPRSRSLGAPGAPPPMPAPMRKLDESAASAPAPPEPAAAISTPARPAEHAGAPTGSDDAGDYTRLPAELDRQFERLDTDGALRATIINPGDPWSLTAQKGLLGKPVTTTLYAAEQRTHKQRAFDLLDALTKSGALVIEDASLHVVLAATHTFDRTLLDTVIEGNVNPIEKVERSLLIAGSTIHGVPAPDLLDPGQRERVLAQSPQLATPSDSE